MRNASIIVRGALRREPGTGARRSGWFESIRLRDVVAGVSVALILVPQSLAYAELAGMPAERGLYAAALPPLAAALFASSPYLQTGPVAITSLLTFGALAELATPGSGEYVALAVLLALLVGLVRLGIGLARSGVLAYLMSQPVLLGFTSAAAILIVLSQVPTAVGVDPRRDGVVERAADALVHPAAWETSAVVLSLATLAVVLGGARVHALFPGVLVAVAAGVIYGEVRGYEGDTVGSIEGALPPFSLDFPWDSIGTLALPALVIALVGFAEPAAIARTFAAQERRRWDPNREFVSQGAANVAAAVSGGFPVGGSFSRSALNRLSGARTRWSGAVTGLAVLAFLPFGAALSPLPKAVLAAIVIAAVVGLIRVLPLVRLVRYSRGQFAVGAATFALTLALSPRVERALVIGILLSIGLHLRRELSLEVASWTEVEALHLRPRGVLWFGSARTLEDAVLKLLAEHADAERLIVHLDALGRIDMTGALALRALLQDAREAGVSVEVVDVRPRWRGLVERVIEREDDPLR
jgi:sulfate permease, SulP family